MFTLFFRDNCMRLVLRVGVVVILPLGSRVILSFCQRQSVWTSKIGSMRLRAIVELCDLALRPVAFANY